MTKITKRKSKRNHISAAAAAALLVGSASAIAAIGEHEQERTDPTAAYEQQQQQDQQTRQQEGTAAQQDRQTRQQEGTAAQQDRQTQQGTAAQQDDQWQDDQAQVGQERQAGGQAIQQFEQLAQQQGNLNTFVKALEEAGMADALVGTTEYTIFAPTDEAFEQYDRSPQELLAPENREELISLLRAHIVADDVDPQMARSIGQALTIDGGTVQLQADQEQEDRFQVGQASVVDRDIQQNNLRIYAIDQVLQPSEFAAFEPGAADDRDDGMMQRDTGTDAEARTGADRDADFDRDRDTDLDVDVDVDVDRDTQRDTDW
jgi:uncharacterized surface protein with fasciclin (FAS1) repeats